jgi:hypothetical protein
MNQIGLLYKIGVTVINPRKVATEKLRQKSCDRKVATEKAMTDIARPT